MAVQITKNFNTVAQAMSQQQYDTVLSNISTVPPSSTIFISDRNVTIKHYASSKFTLSSWKSNGRWRNYSSYNISIGPDRWTTGTFSRCAREADYESGLYTAMTSQPSETTLGTAMLLYWDKDLGAAYTVANGSVQFDGDPVYTEGTQTVYGTKTFTGRTIITGSLLIKGTAAERHLVTRGIGGCDTSGTTTDDLYVNYGTDYGLRVGSSGQFYVNGVGKVTTSSSIAANNGFIGDLTGQATKALQDGNGNIIATTYLPLSGGVMTGEVVVGQGDGYGIQLGTNGRINATINNSTTATICGVNGGTALLGHGSFATQVRGSAITLSANTAITGNLTIANEKILQFGTLYAPISSGSSTNGPGNNGQVLKTNGSTVYWGTDNDLNTWRAVSVNGTQILSTTAGTPTLNFSSGTKIAVSEENAAGNIQIDHIATTRTNTTSAATPAHAKTFTVIDSVSTDVTGHVTGVNTKTVTIPAIPTATNLVLGGVKPAYSTTNTAIFNSTPGSLTTTPTIQSRTELSDRYYGIEADSNGRLFVNVPWVNTNTHYNAYLYAGAATSTTNAATVNGNTYLILVENGTARSRRKIYGSGSTTVISNASGEICITTPTTLSGFTDDTQTTPIAHAQTSDKLTAGRTIQTILENDSPSTFDGSANITVGASGTLPTRKGGTGTTVSPIQGGIIYGSSTSAYASTAAGNSGQYLTSNGTLAPSWTSFATPTASWNSASGEGQTLTITFPTGGSKTAKIASATTSSSGVVTTTAQTFAGAKTFNGGITVAAGQNLQTNKIVAPTSSGGTTYGVGSSGKVLCSNGSTTYWGNGTYTTIEVTDLR